MIKTCKICGSKFEAACGKACYCSDYCREIGVKAISRAYQRSRYVKKPKIKTLVCAKCGAEYRGHYNSKYCDKCLINGDGTMHMYYSNRIYTEEKQDEIS